ncbi:PREDICTED: UDP-glucuronosyltransferase 2B1-like, partial [Rhagoletis zephyria]|uniref:UDP-glucuronosyltransferase 2B1-like n=1 Tax=Rhagoletis zephyria TaxID=28612 RepID=UPI0008119AAE
CSRILVGLLAFAMLAAQAPSTDGARILAVYAAETVSHYQMHRTLISELVKHGHEVTMITAITLEPLKLGSNYTEILIEPAFDSWKFVKEIIGKKTNLEMENSLSTYFEIIKYVAVLGNEHTLKQPKVQALINSKKTEGVYDLLLVEQLHQEAFLALAHVYKIPVVSSATFAQQNYMSQMFGHVTPWSYVPMEFLPFSDRMNFWERALNSYCSLRLDLFREFEYFPKMDALVQKYFGHLPIEFPSVSAMEKNHSAILINNYTPLAFAEPKMDNMIFVGGLHINPPRLNLKKAETAGFAVTLDNHTLTHDDFTSALNEVLFNPKYRDTAKRFSRIFRDRPIGPRETLIYWIDYVIRHNGARHLRAAGMDLKWYQFYLLDVAALVLVAVLVAFAVSVFAIRWILQKIRGGKCKQKVQ